MTAYVGVLASKTFGLPPEMSEDQARSLIVAAHVDEYGFGAAPTAEYF
jgi:hypothetical protein